MIRHRGIEPQDRPLLAALLQAVRGFTDEERAVALELVDHRLEHPAADEYRFILGFASPCEGGPEELAGYVCYGHTPLTRSSYDLYWIVTSPAYARSGVARGLLHRIEGEIAREGGGLLRVETGSGQGRGAAVYFYDAVGFARASTIADFYAPGDDLLTFVKRVRRGAGADADAHDEAALHDAAFGYRDYDAERDFLLACARRFGDGDVRRVLAWSSGSGRHLQAFAAAGVGGVGTDPSPQMVAYAERLAEGQRLPDVRFVCCALDEPPQAEPRIDPVDLSFVLLSAIHQLGTPAAMERHLRVAAGLLRPGGIHVVEATHPNDLTTSGVHHTEWTEVRGETTVDARFRMHIDRLSPERVVPVTLEVARTTGKKGASSVGPRFRQEDRWFIPDLQGWLAIVAAVPELTWVATLGGFDVHVPHDHGAAWRLILVLQRRP